jgi:hypothetical protein
MAKIDTLTVKVSDNTGQLMFWSEADVRLINKKLYSLTAALYHAQEAFANCKAGDSESSCFVAQRLMSLILLASLLIRDGDPTYPAYDPKLVSAAFATATH